MNRSDNQSLYILALILFLLVACSIGLANMVTSRPAYAMVDADAAFVYPEGDAILLVLESGRYQIDGALFDGCYRLDKPAAGKAYGAASYVGETCQVRP